jgi:hypothetical protein
MLRPQSWRAYLDPTEHAAYLDIPSGYLYCTLDQAMLPEYQTGIVGAAKAAGAKIVWEETLEASHSPFLSKIEETSAFIREIASA